MQAGKIIVFESLKSANLPVIFCLQVQIVSMHRLLEMLVFQVPKGYGLKMCLSPVDQLDFCFVLFFQVLWMTSLNQT